MPQRMQGSDGRRGPGEGAGGGAGACLPGRPDGREYLRLGLTAGALAAVSCALFAARWWVAAVVLCILTVVFVAGCLAVGALFARFVVGRKPSKSSDVPAGGATRGKEGGLGARVSGAVSDLGTLIFAAGDPQADRAAREELARRGIDPDDPAVRADDRAVGPMLACMPPADDAFSGAGMPAATRAHLRDERLAERERTLAWLGSAPEWELVRIAAEDGVDLAGHVLAADPSSGRWVVLVHGYRGTWRETIQYARRWSQAGYNLLAVEQRAHGRSGGEVSGMGWLERRDLVAWCRWLAEGTGAGLPCSRIVLHGHSMGAATVAIASAEPDLPDAACAAVADCAFSSAWAAIVCSMTAADVPCRPALDLMRLHLRLRRGGYDIARADAAAALAKPGLPVLVVHGEADPLVPVEMGRALYDAAAREKRLLVVPGAGHCQAVLADGDGYFETVLDFVESCGRPTRAAAPAL